MLKPIILGGLASLFISGAAVAQTCATYPNTLTNGSTADATQVMANFNCAALLGGAHFTSAIDAGSTPEKISLNSASLGFNRRTTDGYIYNNTVYAYQWQHYGNTTAGSDVLGLQVYTPSGALVTGLALTVDGNGYVGVGTSDPSFGGALISSFTAIAPGFTAIAAGYNATTPSFAIDPQSNGSWVMFDHGSGAWTTDIAGVSGNVGIGTMSPSYLLHVNGTAYAVGAAGALSDARHKDKIQPLAPGALQLVERLKPVTFVWKDPKDDGMRGEQIGFIAQDVRETLPDVVLVEKNAEKTMGIKYDEIIPVLTAAIQEQQAEIVALKAEVAALKAR